MALYWVSIGEWGMESMEMSTLCRVKEIRLCACLAARGPGLGMGVRVSDEGVSNWGLGCGACGIIRAPEISLEWAFGVILGSIRTI